LTWHGALPRRSIPLFRRCDDADVKAVDALATELKFGTEHTLTVQGRRQREVLVLVEGSAEVLRDGEKLAELGPGDLIGELEALTLAPSRVTVRTTQEARALVMSDSEFRMLLDARPRITGAVLGAVARRETLAA
jgi:CRP/FNR family transcriptional regulator, cyclic AMP receptor protein